MSKRICAIAILGLLAVPTSSLWAAKKKCSVQFPDESVSKRAWKPSSCSLRNKEEGGKSNYPIRAIREGAPVYPSPYDATACDKLWFDRKYCVLDEREAGGVKRVLLREFRRGHKWMGWVDSDDVLWQRDAIVDQEHNVPTKGLIRSLGASRKDRGTPVWLRKGPASNAEQATTAKRLAIRYVYATWPRDAKDPGKAEQLLIGSTPKLDSNGGIEGWISREELVLWPHRMAVEFDKGTLTGRRARKMMKIYETEADILAAIRRGEKRSPVAVERSTSPWAPGVFRLPVLRHKRVRVMRDGEPYRVNILQVGFPRDLLKETPPGNPDMTGWTLGWIADKDVASGRPTVRRTVLMSRTTLGAFQGFLSMIIQFHDFDNPKEYLQDTWFESLDRFVSGGKAGTEILRNQTYDQMINVFVGGYRTSTDLLRMSPRELEESARDPENRDKLSCMMDTLQAKRDIMRAILDEESVGYEIVLCEAALDETTLKINVDKDKPKPWWFGPAEDPGSMEESYAWIPVDMLP